MAGDMRRHGLDEPPVPYFKVSRPEPPLPPPVMPIPGWPDPVPRSAQLLQEASRSVTGDTPAAPSVISPDMAAWLPGRSRGGEAWLELDPGKRLEDHLGGPVPALPDVASVAAAQPKLGAAVAALNRNDATPWVAQPSVIPEVRDVASAMGGLPVAATAPALAASWRMPIPPVLTAARLNRHRVGGPDTVAADLRTAKAQQAIDNSWQNVAAQAGATSGGGARFGPHAAAPASAPAAAPIPTGPAAGGPTPVGPRPAGTAPAPAPAAPAAAPAPAPAGGGGAPPAHRGFFDWLAGTYQPPAQGKTMADRIQAMVDRQTTPEARAAAEAWAGPLRGGLRAAHLAANLAGPAGVVLPALASAAGAGDQYGEAGAAVAGVSTGAGALAGSLVGQQLGALLPFGPGRGGRLAGRFMGALAGGGLGNLAGGGLNAVAQAAVDRASAGEAGLVADAGRALDALGYRGTNDVIRAQMAAMQSNPVLQLAQAQKRLQEEKQRSEMVQQIYLQALMQQGGLG